MDAEPKDYMNTTEAIIALIKDGWDVHISPHKVSNVIWIVVEKIEADGSPRQVQQALSLADKEHRKDDLLAFQLEYIYNKLKCGEACEAYVPAQHKETT